MNYKENYYDILDSAKEGQTSMSEVKDIIEREAPLLLSSVTNALSMAEYSLSKIQDEVEYIMGDSE